MSKFTKLMIMLTMVSGAAAQATEASILKAVNADSVVLGFKKGVEAKYSLNKAAMKCKELRDSDLKLTFEAQGYAEFEATFGCYRETQSPKDSLSVMVKISGYTSTADNADPWITLSDTSFDFAGE